MKALISIKTIYANQIFNGTKKYEYRKSPLKDHILNDKVYVYSAGGDKKIIGYVIFDHIIKGNAKKLEKLTNIEPNFLSDYFAGREGYALHIKEYHLFNNPIKLKGNMPQYYRYLKPYELKILENNK